MENRPHVRVVVRRRRTASPTGERDDHSPARQKVPSSMTEGGVVEEEEEVEYDHLNLDALTGIDGSTIAYTDSTDLDKHMFTFDLPSGDRNFHLSDSYYGSEKHGEGTSASGFHGDGVKHGKRGDGFYNNRASDVVGNGGGLRENVEVEGSDGEDVEVLYVADGDGYSVRRPGDEGELLVAGNKIGKNLEKMQSKHVQTLPRENEMNDDSYKNSARSLPGDSTSSIRSDLNLVSSSRGDNFDIETNTTISEEMIDPLGINRIDIRTHVTGTIPEEELGMGVNIAYKGEGHLDQGQGELQHSDGDEGDGALITEESDWAKQAEAASHKESEAAQMFGPGDDNTIDTNISLTDLDSARTNMDETLAQQSAQHIRTSPLPIESSIITSHPSSPIQRPSSVKSQRRQSVLSARSRGTPTPPGSAKLTKSPSPIGIVQGSEPPQSPSGKKSPTARKTSEIGSRPSSEYSKRSQTPDSGVGKATPIEVVITRKTPSELAQSQLVTDVKPNVIEKVTPSPPTTTPRVITPVQKAPSPKPEERVKLSPKQQKSPSPHLNRQKSPLLEGQKSPKSEAQKSPNLERQKSPLPERQKSPSSKKETAVEITIPSTAVQDNARNLVAGDGTGTAANGGTVAEAGGTPVVEGGMGDDDAASVASSLLQEQDIILPKGWLQILNSSKFWSLTYLILNFHVFKLLSYFFLRNTPNVNDTVLIVKKA